MVLVHAISVRFFETVGLVPCFLVLVLLFFSFGSISADGHFGGACERPFFGRGSISQFVFFPLFEDRSCFPRIGLVTALVADLAGLLGCVAGALASGPAGLRVRPG